MVGRIIMPAKKEVSMPRGWRKGTQGEIESSDIQEREVEMGWRVCKK